MLKVESTYFKKYPNNSLELEVLSQQNIVIEKKKRGGRGNKSVKKSYEEGKLEKGGEDRKYVKGPLFLD